MAGHLGEVAAASAIPEQYLLATSSVHTYASTQGSY